MLPWKAPPPPEGQHVAGNTVTLLSVPEQTFFSRFLPHSDVCPPARELPRAAVHTPRLALDLGRDPACW